MASSEEVKFAYRYLLGREPENEVVLSDYAFGCADWRELRKEFLDSSEFKLQQKPLPRLPLDVPAMTVETHGPSDKLKKLFSITGKQWSRLGTTEPHWSVLTQEPFLRGNLSNNREAFYASGESDVQMLINTMARAGLCASDYSHCLEFGCGIGRVTAPLARCFSRVTGVDISAPHIELAAEHAQDEDLRNIEFRQIREIDDLQTLDGFDLLFSRLVLQHNPPPVTARLLDQLLLQLSPGGVAFIQIPTYKSGYRFIIDEYLANPNSATFDTHFFPQTQLLQLIAKCQCTVLEIREDDSIGQSVDFISNTLLIQKQAFND